ncbi:Interferon-stimulated 20 kDa exonuclease-like 2 [Geodia barretti]|uniref:Interferon-stimulated 20 kDa exonuclease-like 2 n=1 Tax=Geodia barretti TaxID=519541 RepID=A0AA35WSR6_GEOBA|nr:Interferon-stimulated 20 kDa exonuclease-like 2 [Geodia barretti]
MATRSLPEKYVCIDVECVATGRRHDARSVALVAIVDQDERVLLKKKVKPRETVMSYLTPLTGLREGDLDDGEPLESVLAEVKRILSPEIVLVGQLVKNDVQWLKLREGEHFSCTVDLGELFKAYNHRFSNYNYFPLSHEANTLLYQGFISDERDQVTDAKASVQLLKKFYADSGRLEEAKKKLLRNRPPPSWVKQNNCRWEGVCLAAYFPEKCFCGAPTKKT